MDVVSLNTLCRFLTVDELLARSRVTLSQFRAAKASGNYRKELQLRDELNVLRPHLWNHLRRLLLDETVAQILSDDDWHVLQQLADDPS